MSESLIYTIIALFAGSVGSVALAGLLFLLKDKKLQLISTHLTYLAGGTLLGAAFLGMIPKAISMGNIEMILILVLAGIVFFFILEKIIIWRTCRNKNCERHLDAAAPMILIGDAFHNAIDGVVIAAAFLTSKEMGFFVTLSVIFHEIPQELGDLGILLKSGMTRSKALIYFLYIALADLIPEMHKKTKMSEAVIQIALVLAGIAIIFMIKNIQ